MADVADVHKKKKEKKEVGLSQDPRKLEVSSLRTVSKTKLTEVK